MRGAIYYFGKDLLALAISNGHKEEGFVLREEKSSSHIYADHSHAILNGPGKFSPTQINGTFGEKSEMKTGIFSKKNMQKDAGSSEGGDS